MSDIAQVRERLAAFAGTWEGEETVHPTPWGPGGPAEGRLTFRTGVGGTILILDYLERRTGATALEGHGVFTLDPQSGEVLFFWFDSFGFPPTDPARGGWEGDTLVLTRTTARGIGVNRFRIADGCLHWSIDSRPAGAETLSPVMTGKYSAGQ